MYANIHTKLKKLIELIKEIILKITVVKINGQSQIIGFKESKRSYFF
jgi:hypothetical protein